MVETLKKLTGDRDVAVTQPKKLFEEEEEEEEEIQEDTCFADSMLTISANE